MNDQRAVEKLSQGNSLFWPKQFAKRLDKARYNLSLFCYNDDRVFNLQYHPQILRTRLKRLFNVINQKIKFINRVMSAPYFLFYIKQLGQQVLSNLIATIINIIYIVAYYYYYRHIISLIFICISLLVTQNTKFNYLLHSH